MIAKIDLNLASFLSKPFSSFIVELNLFLLRCFNDYSISIWLAGLSWVPLNWLWTQRYPSAQFPSSNSEASSRDSVMATYSAALVWNNISSSRSSPHLSPPFANISLRSENYFFLAYLIQGQWHNFGKHRLLFSAYPSMT